MRPSDKRDGAPDVRIGRHRAKLDEIRESLKAYEHEQQSHHNNTSSSSSMMTTTATATTASSSSTNNHGSGGDGYNNGPADGVSHLYRTEISSSHKTRLAPMPQRHIQDIPNGPEMIYRNFMSSRNGNFGGGGGATTTPPFNNYRFEMQQISPVFQRPPPPAYDAPPAKNLRMTPVASDNYRTHLHIKTQPPILNHHKTMAPQPPAEKSMVSIETNVIDSSKNDAQHQLYHTSLDKKNSNSVVSINVASPHTTKVNVGDGPISTKSFVIGPRYTTDMERTKMLLNYTDELRQDPRMIPSSSESNANHLDDELMIKNRHILFKPPNLDITFQSSAMSQRQETSRSRSSPLDRALLDSYCKNQRRVQACKPNMFRFYMEQHVERLLQQYREREKRMRQLEKEMNAANLPDDMRQRMLQFLQQKESRYTRLRRQKMSKSHFNVISHIGLGAFGKVSLVRKKDTGKVYAMKSLEKADVIIKQQAAHVKAERDILAEADSPWIVRLFFSFQDEAYLYFIMEYVPGGDMMTLLMQKGIFEESLARFYIAELTCAIEYVHSVGFIHRDIKPDNILIDQNGHIKLTDFGLCTGLRWTHDRRFYGPENEHQRVDSFSLPPDVANIERSVKLLNVRQQNRRQFAHSVVGTGNYMAPEVIARSGHTQSCDWWSMGVILYEMVFGRVPFHADNPKETQYRILNWRQFLDVSYGGHLTPQCLNMVQQLVCDVTTRIGSIGGATQIKLHPWFKDIDFVNLRKSRAEYIPKVEHDEDTSNFDTFQINDKTEKPVRALNNPAFYEFTYRHFFDTDSVGCPSLRPATRRRSLRPLLENGTFEESTTTTSMSEDDASSHI